MLTDEDDPEKRIAELERQAAERQRGAARPAASADAAAASGRFTGYKWGRPPTINMPTQPRPFVICVTTHGLTVGLWPGDVFAFRDAQLGLWVHGSMAMGTALHLQCGAHRWLSADEIIALLPTHSSKQRLWTASTGGCGPQTSMSFSP